MLKLLIASLLFNDAFTEIIPRQGNFEFLILHNNDIHGRFAESREGEGGRLVGGFARTSHLIKEARKASSKGKGPPVLYFNAGDTYSGTVWFTVHRENITTEFMNALKPDAMCLGNHEFDYGIKGLVPFLENLTFPIVSTNLDLTYEPDMQKFVRKSAVLDFHARKIGIVGYLTPDTPLMSPVGEVQFFDEVDAVRAETERLVSQGINIIIALGHSGYKMDKKIAEEVKEVDIVVGGHSNTFLWNGAPPDKEIPKDGYPTKVTQSSGKIVLVVQAFAFTKYLGKLRVTFDNNGELKSFDGQPIFMDESIPQDPEVLKLLDKYRPALVELNTTVVGQCRVFLEGISCRKEECNYGNLVTDAFVHYRSSRYNGTYWTDTPIGVMNAGSLRQSINASLRDHNVYKADVLDSLPFGELLCLIELKGSDIWETLEIGTRSDGETTRGEFLMTAGLKVEYDFLQPKGSRVKSVKVRCADCDVPSHSPIDLESYYKIITTGFVARGGDGHTVVRDKSMNSVVLEHTEYEAVVQYFQAVNVVIPELEGRTIVNESDYNIISGILLLISVSFNIIS